MSYKSLTNFITKCFIEYMLTRI